MKIISIIYFLFFPFCIMAQKSNKCEIILLKSILRETNPKKNYYWIINGERYDNSISIFKIKTHYPLLDTIQFCDETHQHFHTILTRFTPSKQYYFKSGCCGEGFDLISKNEFEQMHLSKFDDDKRIELVKRTIFTMTVIGLPQNDTIVCYFGDNYGVNFYQNTHILKNSTKYNLTIDKNADTNMITQFFVLDSSNVKEIANYYLRFMDTKKVDLIYNYQSKELAFEFN